MSASARRVAAIEAIDGASEGVTSSNQPTTNDPAAAWPAEHTERRESWQKHWA